jgi:hypothetical protein
VGLGDYFFGCNSDMDDFEAFFLRCISETSGGVDSYFDSELFVSGNLGLSLAVA